MTDWKAAGVKADAARVANLARDIYANSDKAAIRRWIVQELLAHKPSLVLDLWGGGLSAETMTAAGLAVLSVEDGRMFADLGVTNPRVKRALQIRSAMDGYAYGWGRAATYAPACDVAWLDFMGHLSGEVVRTLEACRHMKAICITLMPERMGGVQNLPLETWATMYKAAIFHHSGLRVTASRRYRRPHGQWVLVFIASPHALSRKRHAIYLGRRQTAGTEYKARSAERRRERYRTDPEYREMTLARQRAQRADPDYRAKKKAYAKKYYDAYWTPARRAESNAKNL